MKLKDLLTNKRGQWAEQLAEKHLCEKGMILVQRNYSCPRGEIDLIMMDTDTIAFIEVRYRKNQQYGGGIESIDTRKQNKLRLTAMHYLQQTDRYQEQACRFDAVIISGSPSSPSVNWIKNAF